MIFAEEDLNSLNAIAGLLASFGCDSQAGCVLYIQHKIAKTMDSVSGKPSVYPTNWGNVSEKPSSYPPSAHTHSYITNGGDTTAITGAIGTPGLSLQQAYNNGYPTNYGNVLSIGGHGDGQILAGWSGSNNGIERLYYRNRRDMCDTWSDWRTLAFTTDITSVISQTSDPGAGSSLATGSILLVYA